MNFKVEIENKNIFKKLEEFALELGNTKPLVKLVSRKILNIIDENFETEGKFTGEKWEEWSDIWLERRKKLGKAEGKILNLDGFLRRSITRYVHNDYAVIGSPLKYAAIHNFGSDNNSKINMPQRKFTRIDKVEEERILDDMQEYLWKIKVYKLKKYSK